MLYGLNRLASHQFLSLIVNVLVLQSVDLFWGRHGKSPVMHMPVELCLVGES